MGGMGPGSHDCRAEEAKQAAQETALLPPSTVRSIPPHEIHARDLQRSQALRCAPPASDRWDDARLPRTRRRAASGRTSQGVPDARRRGASEIGADPQWPDEYYGWA